jgi:2-methylaconitate cis-trans-isomerase PrpF
MTAVMAASVAARISGSVVARAIADLQREDLRLRPLRVGHPSGVDQAFPNMNGEELESIEINLDARRIFSGEIHLPLF